MVSILRLPMSMTYDSYSGPDTGAAGYRGHADGATSSHMVRYVQTTSQTLHSNHVIDVTKYGRTSTIKLLQNDHPYSEHNVGEKSIVNIVLFWTGHSYPLTRMHSSRMRTARSSSRCGEGVWS